MKNTEFKEEVSKAVRYFWQVRKEQMQTQGTKSVLKDPGNRGAVTAGKHLDGFLDLVVEIGTKTGLSQHAFQKRVTTLPGFFRPTKKWDLVIVADNKLLASIEFKSQVGSFGNNFNNRIEEAVGSATDLLTAFREGKFNSSMKPWLGWVMLLENSPHSTSEIALSEPYFEVFPEFKESSYVKRYELFCERLVRERLYDATCLILSDEKTGLSGEFQEPNPNFGFRSFAFSLIAKLLAYVAMWT